MIKGVHRQMIEVTHTGSPYFERAFLVVRGEAADTDREKLDRLAGKVVEQAATYRGLRHQRLRRWGQRALFGLTCAGGGALLLWALQHLLP